MKSKLAILLLVGVLGIAATGCGDDDTTTDTGDTTTSAASDTSTTAPASDDSSDTSVDAGDPGATADGSWALDATASSLTDAGEAGITLTIEGDAAHGSAGCNSYNGGVAIDGTSISFGDLAMTRMMCEEPLMAAEAEYTAALAAVDTVDAGPDQLVLTGPDGTTLVFTAIDPSAEIVGEWSIVNYATTDAITGPVEGTEATITFVDDGTVAVSTGCNTLATTYTLDGDALTFETAAATMMACEEPAGVMDQEAALSAALENAASVTVSPGQLTILNAEGNILIVATQDT